MKLSPKSHELLCEALRRFECFAVRRDGKKWNLDYLQSTWVGLGTATEYKPVVANGLMKMASPINRGCSGWWSLTELGAKIVLKWHKQGFGCVNGHSYKFGPLPPLEIEP